jgi:hypothetical protein
MRLSWSGIQRQLLLLLDVLLLAPLHLLLLIIGDETFVVGNSWLHIDHASKLCTIIFKKKCPQHYM